MAELTTQFETVSEVLADSVGVQVRRLGGLGSYGAASIRGSSANQVPVYLDGVLLNAGGFSSVNLSDLALDTIQSIEVYRGSTPARFSVAGIGGVLSLSTRRFDQAITEAAVTYGSFETVRWYYLRGTRLTDDLRLLALATLTTSDGDYIYLNNNGTKYNTEDDRLARRENNETLSADALLKLDGSLGLWRWTVANDTYIKDQGVAALSGLPDNRSQLVTLRNATTCRIARSFLSGYNVALDASYLYIYEDFFDGGYAHTQGGESSQTYLSMTHAASLGALIESAFGEQHFSSARFEFRYERYTHREIRSQIESGPKQRLRSILALDHEWSLLPSFVLVPSARLEMHNSFFAGGDIPGGLGQMEALSQHDLFWQAGLGARLQLTDGLWLRSNVGRYTRAPDLSELFGDRGLVIGNWELKPESGLNLDFGFSLGLHRLGFMRSLRLDCAGFVTLSRDLIAYVQNSQKTIRPDNVASAEVVGLETSLNMEVTGWLTLSGNYTYLYTINKEKSYSGKRLPGRVPHEAYAKIQLGDTWTDWAAKGYLDLSYASLNYVTAYNDRSMMAGSRMLLGMGVKGSFLRHGLSLGLEIKNLLNTYSLPDENGIQRPLYDFHGFPLPGRTIMLTLHWKT